jgi:hypothetical protein
MKNTSALLSTSTAIAGPVQDRPARVVDLQQHVHAQSDITALRAPAIVGSAER